MKRRVNAVVVGAASLLTLSLAACAPSSSNAGGSASGGAAGAGCKTGPVTVGIIPKLGTDPYMVTVRKAAEAAAAKDGSKVIYTSPSDATGAAQIPFVNQLISQNVDVIM